MQNFQNLATFSKFGKIFKIWQNVQILAKFSKFGNIFKVWQHFQNLAIFQKRCASKFATRNQCLNFLYDICLACKRPFEISRVGDQNGCPLDAMKFGCTLRFLIHGWPAQGLPNFTYTTTMY